MKKTELIACLAERCDLSKRKAAEVIDVLCEVIVDEVAQGNDVQLYNFGTFARSLRKQRVGINPQTKEKISIPAHYLPVFKSGEAFRKTVNNDAV